MAARLGILAGGGDLPARLAEAARGSGREVVIVAFEGHTAPSTVNGWPHLWSRFGAAATVLDFLRRHQVTELVFAGPVRRPSLSEVMPDWRVAKFLAKVGLRALGDDGFLQAIRRGLEEEGFRIVGIQDILQDLLAPAGPLGALVPDEVAEIDIARGVEVARALGLLDVGQAAVVQQGLVLGVEGIEGTDALIARCGALRREGPGGVLVKVKKPQQDRRLDLPTIGVNTVQAAAAAGLRGVAVEAGGALVMDRAEMIAAADRAGLFVVGVEVTAEGAAPAGPDRRDSKIVRLAGDEIAPVTVVLPALREAAYQWYESHLRHRSETNVGSGHEIRFLSGKKFISTSANPDKLRVLPALSALVRSVPLGSPQVPEGKAPNIKAYYQLFGDVYLAGRVVRVVLTIREDNHGFIYYNHNITGSKPSALPGSGAPHKAGTGLGEREVFCAGPAGESSPSADDHEVTSFSPASGAPRKAGTGIGMVQPYNSGSISPCGSDINTPPLTLFLIAGEPSGDVLGARLMAALKAMADRPVRFVGVGGERMIAEGLESLFPMAELAVMGVLAALPRLPRLIARIDQTVTAIRDVHPDAIVTIDAPGFCFRVGKRLRRGDHPVRDIPLIHYVAPSVWAWRPGRARKVARFLDHLLALLPCEPPWFEREGLPCTFVGHSVVEGGADRGDGPGFRARHGLAPETRLIAVLPGSRTSELRWLLPDFRGALERLAARYPGLTAVVPVVPHLAGQVRAAVAGWPLPVLVVEGDADKYDAFAAAEVALAASGTVALELALARLPAVIAYRLNAVAGEIYRALISTKYVCLVNILHGREVVPELLQEKCRPDRLAAAVSRLLDDPAARQAQVEALVAVDGWLGAGGPPPSRRAAEVVWRLASRTPA